MILECRQDHRGSLSATDIIKLDCFCDLLDSETVCWAVRQASDIFSVLEVCVSLFFSPTTCSY